MSSYFIGPNDKLDESKLKIENFKTYDENKLSQETTISYMYKEG